MVLLVTQAFVVLESMSRVQAFSAISRQEQDAGICLWVYDINYIIYMIWFDE